MTWLPNSRVLLSAAALGSFATVVALVALTPQTATADNSNQVCCESENGTYNPVSENGKAADSCVSTWDIPEDEIPGQYCKLGPQSVEDPVLYCALSMPWTSEFGHPDPNACTFETPEPDRFFCYLGFSDTGDLACCAQSFTGDADDTGCLVYHPDLEDL